MNPTTAQLKRALAIKEQIEKLEAEFAQILKGSALPKPVAVSAKPAKRRRKMSAAGRARIAAAQKARWAKKKAGTSAPAAKKPGKPAKRNISPEGRARMAEAARKRWAKIARTP